jgi:hypothetical protein
LAEGISAILTAGIPTGSPEDARFVATVLSVGGVELGEVERVELSDDDLEAGVESRASAKAGSVLVTILVFENAVDAEVQRGLAASAIACGRIVVAIEEEPGTPSPQASLIFQVLESRYGPCER